MNASPLEPEALRTSLCHLRVGVNNMELLIPGSNRTLLDIVRDVRLSMLRAKRYVELSCLLGELEEIARSVSDTRAESLARLLRGHNQWHLTGFDSVDEILAASAGAPWTVLATVLSGFYLNTYGAYEKSFVKFAQVQRLPKSPEHDVAAYILDMDLAAVCVTWKFWNRNETSSVEGLREDVEFVQRVLLGDTPCEGQARVQLFLASGLYFLNHNGLDDAMVCLQESERSLIGRHSRLYPRVASALAICLHRRGERLLAETYFRDAFEGMDSHFGPLGWQLRIAWYLAESDRVADALLLIDRIRDATRRKNENGYNIWARIYEQEWKGTPDIAAADALVKELAALDMRRATAYLLSRSKLLHPAVG